jgi:signal transduction histidine kinase
VVAFLDFLPRGSTLSDEEFTVRHTFLQWVLLLHLPALLAFGLVRHYSLNECVEAIAAPAAFLLLSRMLRTRRLAGLAVTAGLSTCSASLVVLSGGAIEAHFHFFITIGLIALYQDWVPFVWNALFTVFSHGVGSLLLPEAFFAHYAGQHHPWTWGLIHGISVLAACVGVILLLRFNENDHRRAVAMRAELVEGNRKRFTADLLVNLARRNQSLIYRQLELLNGLEDHERDAEQLSHLFQLDHLATRIRRNAESLLVLSGEEPARKWGGSVLLVDVVRAAIAEIEELDRVDFAVDESLQVSGRAVADATHLLAELIENAVHFSPPGLSVMIRTRPYLPSPGAQVLTIEDWGVGMSAGDIADANDLMRLPREVDLATSQRLGLHVVARLAARYGIECSLNSTPGGGVTAVVVLPAELFATVAQVDRTPVGVGARRRLFGAEPDAVLDDSGLSVSGLSLSGLSGPGLSGPGLSGPGLSGPGLSGPSGGRPGRNGHGVSSTGLLDEPGPTPRNGTSLNGTPVHVPGLDGAGRGRVGHGPGHRAGRGAGHGAGSGPGNGLSNTGNGNELGSGSDGRDGGEPTGLVERSADPENPLGTDGGPELGPELGTELRTELSSGVGYFGGAPDSPLPAPRGDQSSRSGREDSWSSWWPLPADADGPGRDLSPPGRDLSAPGPDLPAPDSSLARRTPQANLADELRRGVQPEPDGPDRPVRPRRDPAQARSALSRFQTTQRAAREAGRRDTDTDGEAHL